MTLQDAAREFLRRFNTRRGSELGRYVHVEDLVPVFEAALRAEVEAIAAELAAAPDEPFSDDEVDALMAAALRPKRDCERHAGGAQ